MWCHIPGPSNSNNSKSSVNNKDNYIFERKAKIQPDQRTLTNLE